MIDAGSLQTMDPKLIPQNAILTPNKKEFKLFALLSSKPGKVFTREYILDQV